MKVLLDNGELSPEAEYWAGIFLLVVLVVCDVFALMGDSRLPWYAWIMGIAWIALSVSVICHGRKRLRVQR
jgi:hypothetical protein